MSSAVRNPLKAALRKQMKGILLALSPEDNKRQSDAVTKKIFGMDVFKRSKRISVYLSLAQEINTHEILSEMFRQQKEVFVPSYSGNRMVMLKIKDMQDFQSLPLTKWNIRQPDCDGSREDASESGGLDLILMPGVAFTQNGGRCGHGMGYYDKFLQEHFNKNPHRQRDPSQSIEQKLTQKETVLLGLALNEQIVDEVPLDATDVLLDGVVTA